MFSLGRRLRTIALAIAVSACSALDPLADEELIGDQPLAWKAAGTTPNRAGRKCTKDDLETYAARFFEHRAARLRYLERYRHCVA